MQQLLSGSIEAGPVASIEGTPTSGTFLVKPMLAGDCMALLEVRMLRGVSSQMHTHSHESVLYVVSGSLKIVVADEAFIVRSGQACRHPKDVMHSVEALEDTLFVEIKSPVPALDATFGDPR
jgi:quercetin dioxygenase-like cupin family protein